MKYAECAANADASRKDPMTRTPEDICNNTFPVGKQPLPQGGLHIQAPFHPEDYVTVYLTAQEVGKMIHVSVDSVRRLLHAGKIRSTFMGKSYLTTRKDVEDYLQKKRDKMEAKRSATVTK